MRIKMQKQGAPFTFLIVLAVFCLSAGQSMGLAQEKTKTSNQEDNQTPKGEANQNLQRRPLPDEIQATPEAGDEAIQTRLRDILDATDWYKAIDVKVEEGVVFLRGRTGKEEHKKWATDLAQHTENVVAVVNHMQVGGTVDFSRSWSVVKDSLKAMWQDFLAHLPLIAVGFVVLILTWAAASATRMVVAKFLSKSRIRTSLRDLFLQLTTITIWLAGITIAAVVVFPGMTPAKLLTVLGLSSVAIGFAFKDIFENFFAGILILWRFPFDKGDFVECGDLVGRVEDVTVRNTMIRQVDGQLVVVPNAMLFKNPVSVLTNWKSRRVTVICGVAYSEDVDEARQAIASAVTSCETVHQDHDIEVFAQEFASSSINFEVTWWAGNTPLEIRTSRDEVVAAVKRKLDDVDIEIPFPYRTLTFNTPLPIQQSPNGES